MEQYNIFVSVGGTANAQQKDFVELIDNRLRSENLIPNTVGRNKFSANSPLKAVKELMNECSGMLVIALERTYFEAGIEKRGGEQETILSNIKFATPWNQIEAGMAFAKGLPILVIVESGIRSEGLLEKGYDWYVMTINLNQQSLATPEFNGVLSDWKRKVEKYEAAKEQVAASKKEGNPGDWTLIELISNMKLAQLWAVLAAIVALMTGIFVIGQHFPLK